MNCFVSVSQLHLRHLYRPLVMRHVIATKSLSHLRELSGGCPTSDQRIYDCSGMSSGLAIRKQSIINRLSSRCVSWRGIKTCEHHPALAPPAPGVRQDYPSASPDGSACNGPGMSRSAAAASSCSLRRQYTIIETTTMAPTTASAIANGRANSSTPLPR